MAYDLFGVKEIKVISKIDEEQITTTLNQKLKINETAYYNNVTSAINALYRLSNLSAYDIILTKELSIKKQPIEYVALDNSDTWYTGKNIGTVGNSITHEVQYNTLANIITANFNLPSALTNVAKGEANLESGNKILLTITFYKAFSNINTTTGYIIFYTPNGKINKAIPLFLNQEEPTE